jgi:CheY-like chemotaxis protein
MKYKNVLLIDDDRDDHEIFQTAVDQVDSDINCRFLNDATEALSMLEAHEVSPDLIFLDLNMEGMSGEEFLAEIKSRDRLKQIPVIVYTTASSPLIRNIAKKLGALDFITKPPRYSDLIKLLSSILI